MLLAAVLLEIIVERRDPFFDHSASIYVSVFWHTLTVGCSAIPAAQSEFDSVTVDFKI